MTQEEREIAAKAFWIFAIWHDGVQTVGGTGRLLKDAQRDMLSGKMDNLFNHAYIMKGDT